MYYASDAEIKFEYSHGFSWRRQLPPYELYIRTMEDAELPGFIDRLEVIGLTSHDSGSKDEIPHLTFLLDRILYFIELNEFNKAESDSRKFPGMALYIDMAKGSDKDRLTALLQLVRKQKHKLLLSDRAGISIENILKNAGMQVCKRQSWSQKVRLPVADRADIQFIDCFDDMEVNRYPEFLISYREINGIYYDIDNSNDTAFYNLNNKIRALINVEFDAVYLDAEEDRMEQMLKSVIYDSISRGKQVIRNRKLKGPQMLCFQTEGIYHWGVFLPDGTDISKDSIYKILDAAEKDE